MMSKRRWTLIAAMCALSVASLCISLYIPTLGAAKIEVGSAPYARLFQPTAPLASTPASVGELTWTCPINVTIGVANTPKGWSNNLLLSQYAKFEKVSISNEYVSCLYSNDGRTYGFTRAIPASYSCKTNGDRSITCELILRKR